MVQFKCINTRCFQNNFPWFFRDQCGAKMTNDKHTENILGKVVIGYMTMHCLTIAHSRGWHFSMTFPGDIFRRFFQFSHDAGNPEIAKISIFKAKRCRNGRNQTDQQQTVLTFFFRSFFFSIFLLLSLSRSPIVGLYDQGIGSLDASFRSVVLPCRLPWRLPARLVLRLALRLLVFRCEACSEREISILEKYHILRGRCKYHIG